MNLQELLNRGLRFLFTKKMKEKAYLEERERQLHQMNRDMNQLLELQESETLLHDAESGIDHV